MYGREEATRSRPIRVRVSHFRGRFSRGLPAWIHCRGLKRSFFWLYQQQHACVFTDQASFWSSPTHPCVVRCFSSHSHGIHSESWVWVLLHLWEPCMSPALACSSRVPRDSNKPQSTSGPAYGAGDFSDRGQSSSDCTAQRKPRTVGPLELGLVVSWTF